VYDMREHTSSYVGSIVCAISLIPRWQYSFNTCISWPPRRRKGKIVERPVSFLDFGRTIHRHTTNKHTHMHQIAMQREDLAQVPTCTVVYHRYQHAQSCQPTCQPTWRPPAPLHTCRLAPQTKRTASVIPGTALCVPILAWIHAERVGRKSKCLLRNLRRYHNHQKKEKSGKKNSPAFLRSTGLRRI
jgi:hypothetical protein